MAFRKRNVAVNQSNVDTPPESPSKSSQGGIRPSPLSSQSVISTGTPSLDALLGGHGGLAIGSSLLIEESGTTDFAGALLKFFAAEGICQGHVLHVVGIGDGWVRELPGLVEGNNGMEETKTVKDDSKMKIAWRYDKLRPSSDRALPDRSNPSFPGSGGAGTNDQKYCHTFDLTKRLTIPQDTQVNHIRILQSPSPFGSILQKLRQSLKSSPSTTIHRLVLPNLLSPALYPSQASRPETFLHFLRSLRAITRAYHTQLTVMMTFPLELYPRESALVRTAEILNDGVLELTPFPHLMDALNGAAEDVSSRRNEEHPQGMAKFHKLPIVTERSEGGAGAGNSLGEDLAFTLSRRKFKISPFSLPPLEGDQDAQKDGKLTSKDVEF